MESTPDLPAREGPRQEGPHLHGALRDRPARRACVVSAPEALREDGASASPTAQMLVLGFPLPGRATREQGCRDVPRRYPRRPLAHVRAAEEAAHPEVRDFSHQTRWRLPRC